MAHYFSFLVFCLFVATAHSYSFGAPSAACRPNSNPNRNVRMVPNHSGILLEKDAPKAQLNVESNGDKLDIKLSAPEQFKGFLIVVQDKDEKMGGKPIGEFILQDGSMQGVRCKDQNSGVTHTTKSLKSNVVVSWQKPSNLDGDEVVVRATVVYEITRGDHVRTSHKL